MVDAANLDHPRRPVVDGSPRSRNGKRRIRAEGVLHREHLHFDDLGPISGIADLEDERAVRSVDPEVPVALPVQRRCLAVDREHGSSDLGRQGRVDLRRASFEDVVAHSGSR
jgi:hypothetical protein